MATTRFISFLILASFACSSAEKKGIERVEWLTGTWLNKTKSSAIYEEWVRLNEQKLIGRSFLLENPDTVTLETIELIDERNTLFYIPTVSDQNNEQPVRFQMNNYTNNLISFENVDHDFPQVISYKRIGNDSLIATISGVRNGEKREVLFPIVSVK